MWGKDPRGNCAACSAFCLFSVTSPATHKQIRPFWCWFLGGGFVYVLGPCGSLQQTLLWGWEFLPLLPQPPWVFSIRGLRLYFPVLEPWVVQSVLLPSWSCLFICMRMWYLPVCNLPTPYCESSPPGYPPLSLLPVWMNVSSLSPWLSDFHTVRFSVSSGWFLFLNCCCPSGCARRHSVSTYASILAGSLFIVFWIHFFLYFSIINVYIIHSYLKSFSDYSISADIKFLHLLNELIHSTGSPQRLSHFFEREFSHLLHTSYIEC